MRRIGYLSGAPRVSTDPLAEASGPRAHVLGVIGAFRALGWEVRTFIVGDRVPKAWTRQGSEKKITGNILRTLAADLVRLVLAGRNKRRAWKELGGNVDCVYERLGVFQALGRPFRDKKIPWILETNALLYEEAKAGMKTIALSSVARRVEAAAYRDCDALVCISEQLKNLICVRHGISPKKMLVVSNGVDTDFFDPAKSAPKKFFKEFTVGFVGTLYAWQGLDLLLRAIHSLRQKHDIFIYLVVAGDGMMRKNWEALARELGLDSQVRFLGRIPHDEIPAVIGGFDLCFSGHCSTTDETYHSPLKIYEYLSMGKPVIASHGLETDSLIAEGGTGFLFRSGDLEDLERALLTAYQRYPHLTTLGVEARSQTVKKYSWKARVAMILEGAERILDRPIA